MTTIDPDAVPPPVPASPAFVTLGAAASSSTPERSDLVIPEIPINELNAAKPLYSGLSAARAMRLRSGADEMRALAEIVRAAPTPTFGASINAQMKDAKAKATATTGGTTGVTRAEISRANKRAAAWYGFLLQDHFEKLGAGARVDLSTRPTSEVDPPPPGDPRRIRVNLRVDVKSRIGWLDAGRPSFARLGAPLPGQGSPPAAGAATILGYENMTSEPLRKIAEDSLTDKSKFGIRFLVKQGTFVGWVFHRDLHRRVIDEFGFLTDAEADVPVARP